MKHINSGDFTIAYGYPWCLPGITARDRFLCRRRMWLRMDPGAHSFFGLFSPGCGEPVRSIWHRNPEPGAFARNAVLGDRDAGDRQDLMGKG